jgi:hypothetical protein
LRVGMRGIWGMWGCLRLYPFMYRLKRNDEPVNV